MATPGGILQNYIAARAQRLAEEQAKTHHEEAQSQLEEISKYHKGELDLRNAMLEQEKLRAAREMNELYMKHVGEGSIIPNNATPNQSVQQETQQGPQDVGGLPQQVTRVNPTLQTDSLNVHSPYAADLPPEFQNLNIVTPEQKAARDRKIAIADIPVKAAEMGAVTEAASSAKLPTAIAEIGAKGAVEKDIQNTKLVGEKELQKQKDAEALKRTQATAAARENAARIQAEARKYSANINSKNKTQVDADELATTAMSGIDGSGDLAPAGSANGIHQRAILKNAGYVPFEGKSKQNDSLNKSADLAGIFADMKEVANALSDNAPGAMLQKIGFGAKLPSDLNNKLMQVKERAPQIVRSVLGIENGKITNTELNNAIDGMVRAGITKTQAIENINKLQRDAFGKVYNDILGSVPTAKQKVQILVQHGMLENMRDAQIREGKDVLPILTKAKNGHDMLWNPQTKTYVDIEGYK